MATSPERPRAQYRRSTSGASEDIAVQIRRWLDEQRLQPGERIGTEQEMADEFGVSRPTLREALRLLSASHLIRVGRGRTGGVFVASTPSEGMSKNVSESISLMLAAQSISMDELVDARLSLEVPIAGRAAVNADDEAIARLEAAIEAAVGHQPGTPPFNAADGSFHQILAEAAGNDLLRALTAWILEVLQPTLVGAHRRPGRRGGHPLAAPRDPARGAPASALRRREGDAGAHRVPGRRATRDRPRLARRGTTCAPARMPAGLVVREVPLVGSPRRRPRPSVTGTVERHAVDAVLAREDHRRGPRVAARWPEQRGDNLGDVGVRLDRLFDLAVPRR